MIRFWICKHCSEKILDDGSYPPMIHQVSSFKDKEVELWCEEADWERIEEV